MKTKCLIFTGIIFWLFNMPLAIGQCNLGVVIGSGSGTGTFTGTYLTDITSGQTAAGAVVTPIAAALCTDPLSLVGTCGPYHESSRTPATMAAYVAAGTGITSTGTVACNCTLQSCSITCSYLWGTSTKSVTSCGADKTACCSCGWYAAKAQCKTQEKPNRISSDENSIDQPIGINSIYPNPSVGYATVEYFTNSTENVVFVVFDMTGRVVFNQMNSVISGVNAIDFDFSGLSEGIYFLTAQSGKDSSHMKFIVQK